MFSRHLPKYRADLISSQNALVVFYMKLGRTADALGMAEDVLAYRREQFADDAEDQTRIKQLGAALNNAANAANETGNYDRAVVLIEEAVDLAPLLGGTVPGGHAMVFQSTALS